MRRFETQGKGYSRACRGSNDRSFKNKLDFFFAIANLNYDSFEWEFKTLPRVLVDINNRILDVAIKHFKLYGYVKTDMKSIAAELDISVGTLYNNFKSKPELFVAVTRKWRSDMDEPVHAILDSTLPPKEKIVEVLLSLLDNAEGFLGIWKELMVVGSQEFPPEMNKEVHKAAEGELPWYLADIEVLAREAAGRPAVPGDVFSAPDHRFSLMLTSASFFLAMRFSGQTEHNRAYLRQYMDFLLDKEHS